jgi:hypothetical protein
MQHSQTPRLRPGHRVRYVGGTDKCEPALIGIEGELLAIERGLAWVLINGAQRPLFPEHLVVISETMSRAA